jgi:hypothetical protein
MQRKLLWLATAAAISASVCCLPLRGSHAPDLPLAPPEPVTLSISDDSPPAKGAETLGVSPYRDWPDAGMRPLPDAQARRDEIHPEQADLINAAYAQSPYRTDGHSRAGWPECTGTRAIPSNSPHYCGYYVGGGAVIFGEGRHRSEGTYGWDYLGLNLRKRVRLDWWHGKYQGGTGAYQTDGPKVFHH